MHSGADNGSAVVLSIAGEDFKESTVAFNEPLKAVCLEPSNYSGGYSGGGAGSSGSGGGGGGAGNNSNNNKGTDRPYLVGTSTGRLILHRNTSWFRQAQKDVVLFGGMGSAVTSIHWEGNLVAWADVAQVSVWRGLV